MSLENTLIRLKLSELEDVLFEINKYVSHCRRIQGEIKEYLLDTEKKEPNGIQISK